jgi:hypothetical protein
LMDVLPFRDPESYRALRAFVAEMEQIRQPSSYRRCGPPALRSRDRQRPDARCISSLWSNIGG